MSRLLLPCLGVALALGACQSRDATGTASISSVKDRPANLDALVETGGSAAPSLDRSLEPTPVVVLPPWIGRPMQLRDREDTSGFVQEIPLTLAPSTETRKNFVRVAVSRSGDGADAFFESGANGMGKPSETGIRAELAVQFPDVAMQVVPRHSKNAYGPYGLAIGKTAQGARCLYAWQWIETPPALDANLRGPLSLRVRLCRADISLEAMANSVSQLKFVGRHAGTPVASVQAPRQHSVAARPRRVHRADTGSANAVSRAPAVELVEAAPSSSGPRYLGADRGPVAHPSGPHTAVPTRGLPTMGVVSAPATRSSGVSADLPPEAYRGPSSNQFDNRL